MSQSFGASRCLATVEQDNTIVAVIEMSQVEWLVTRLYPASTASLSRSDLFALAINSICSSTGRGSVVFQQASEEAADRTV